MTVGCSAFWLFVPNLGLCILLLRVLRRQAASHKLAIARLEALRQALDAPGGGDAAVDRSPACQPQHDLVPKAETKARSGLRSIDALLRRR